MPTRVFYFPFDFAFVVRRVLRSVRPRLLVLMEGEIWPNLLRECRRRGVKTAIVNGRVSARSFPRYRLVRPLIRRVLADVDAFCMQSEEVGAAHRRDRRRPGARDRDRQPEVRRRRVCRRPPFRAARAIACCAFSACRRSVRSSSPAARCAAKSVPCSAPSAASRRRRRQALLVSGAAARRALRRGRCTSPAAKASRRRGDRSWPSTPSPAPTSWCSTPSASWRRSISSRPWPSSAAAWSPTGGHNILEPAVYGRPIVFGPHMYELRRDRRAFLANGAAVQVARRSRARARRSRISLCDPVRRAQPRRGGARAGRRQPRRDASGRSM